MVGAPPCSSTFVNYRVSPVSHLESPAFVSEDPGAKMWALNFGSIATERLSVAGTVTPMAGGLHGDSMDSRLKPRGFGDHKSFDMVS